MRPRKQVLIWSADDGEAGELAMILNICALHIKAHTVCREKYELMLRDTPNLDLVVLLTKDTASVERMQLIPYCPVTVIDPTWPREKQLEWIGIRSSRKRGPKSAARLQHERERIDKLMGTASR